MSLDFILEADERLSTEVVAQALLGGGCLSISEEEGELTAWFPSGMSVLCKRESTNRPPSAEDTRGLVFHVAARCHFRIKGPEPPEHSGLAELERVARAIESTSKAQFVISFQYESLMYWRGADGLHKV